MRIRILEERISEALNEGFCPGLVLLVSKDRDIIYKRAFGYAQVKPYEIETNMDTVYDLASLTKQLATTISIMVLLNEGKIDLHDPLFKYFPEFKDTEKQDISIFHLLTNSAGFTAWRSYYQYLLSKEKEEDRPLIAKPEAKHFIYDFICREELEYKPGTKSVYSDLGFIILGFLIEKVTGMRFDEFCQDYIYKPLNLKSTFFNPIFDEQKFNLLLHKYKFAATENCPWRNKILYGEVHDDNAYALGGVAGHAGLFSCANDIHILLKTLYDCYIRNFHSNFLPSSLVNSFFSKQNIPGSSWCLGWDSPSSKESTSGRYFSSHSVGHTGFTGTSMWMDLNRGVWIIMLSNRVHPLGAHDKFKILRPELHNLIMAEILAMQKRRKKSRLILDKDDVP